MRITPHLLSWQRSKYPIGHKNRLNLLIHVLTAPIFFVGFGLLVWGLVSFSWMLAGAGAVGMFVTLALQGFGHSKESAAPEPFLSPLDFVVRFTAENLITFWRFLFSGEYSRNFRGRP